LISQERKKWTFGMKAHIGVDSHTRLIHSVVATAANVHDSHVLGDLLHGNETRLWGDSAYTGQQHVLAERPLMPKTLPRPKAAETIN
jgi:IS5 family transposase